MNIRNEGFFSRVSIYFKVVVNKQRKEINSIR